MQADYHTSSAYGSRNPAKVVAFAGYSVSDELFAEFKLVEDTAHGFDLFGIVGYGLLE